MNIFKFFVICLFTTLLSVNLFSQSPTYKNLTIKSNLTVEDNINLYDSLKFGSSSSKIYEYQDKGQPSYLRFFYPTNNRGFYWSLQPLASQILDMSLPSGITFHDDYTAIIYNNNYLYYDGIQIRSATDTLADLDTVRALIAGVGGGDVYKVGTPVNDQIGVWTGDGTIEGNTNLQWDGTYLKMGSDTGSTRAYARSVGGSSYTFTNGLIESGGTVKWGDTLDESTIVEIGNYILRLRSTLTESGITIDGNGDDITIYGGGGGIYDASGMFAEEKLLTLNTDEEGKISFQIPTATGIVMEMFTDSINVYDTIYAKYLIGGIPSQPGVLLIDSVNGAIYADSTSAAVGFGLYDKLIPIKEYIKDTENGELAWTYINSNGDTITEYNTKGPELWIINQKLFRGLEHAYRYIDDQDTKIKELKEDIKFISTVLIVLIIVVLLYVIIKR